MLLKIYLQVMPRITVKLFANFREFAKTKEIDVEGGNVREVIEVLCKKFPGMEKMLFKGDSLLPSISVFLNGRNILESGGLAAKLKQGDEIAVFPPVSGG